MSGDLQVRIWAALDASEGELVGALAVLRDGFEDPDIRDATLEALFPDLHPVIDPLVMRPMADLGVRQGDAGFGQAIRECFDEIENPTQFREFAQAVTRAVLLALADAVEAEVPRWRAARGEPESPET